MVCILKEGDLMNIFSVRLKQMMIERNMSQAELAKLIGKCKASVNQYVAGKAVPKPNVQEKIANVLNCAVDWLNKPVDTSENISESLKKVSVSRCAQLLGKSEQFVRVALQKGVAPFGFAVKSKKTYSYHISPKKLSEYIESVI